MSESAEDEPDRPIPIGATFERAVASLRRRAKPRRVTYTVTGYAEYRGVPLVLVRSDYQGDGSMSVATLRAELTTGSISR